MNKKLLGLALASIFLAMLTTPVMAIGPTNAEGKNPNLVTANEGVNTQIWLPSGVMNEWINNPMAPGPFRVTLKDAAKFQIKQAVVVNNPNPAEIMIIFDNENQWFHFSQAAFATLLMFIGGDTANADPYDEGIYIKLVFVGWAP